MKLNADSKSHNCLEKRIAFFSLFCCLFLFWSKKRYFWFDRSLDNAMRLHTKEGVSG